VADDAGERSRALAPAIGHDLDHGQLHVVEPRRMWNFAEEAEARGNPFKQDLRRLRRVGRML
jgi:hypothetical protein